MSVESELEVQGFQLAIGQAKTLVITMDSPPEGGVADWDMRFRLRKRDGTVLITKTSASGITCTDAVNGVWEVALTADDTGGLYPGQPEWSFWDRASGQENPIARGIAYVYRTADLPDPS